MLDSGQVTARRFRIAILLLALLAMLGVVAAADTPAHLHLNSPAGRCDLCFTAHMSAVQSPVAHFVSHMELQGEAVVAEPIFGYRLFTSRAITQRGPPALYL